MAGKNSNQSTSVEDGGSPPESGEQTSLLPNENHRRTQTRRPSGSRLWLLPAVVFLLLMTFLTHQWSVWLFQGSWASKAQLLSADLDYTDKLEFSIEGNGEIQGTIDLVEIGERDTSALEIEVFTLSWDNEGVKSVRVDNQPGGVVLKCERPEGSIFARSIPPIKIHAKLHLQPERLKEILISTKALDVNLHLVNFDLSRVIIQTESGAVLSNSYFSSSNTDIHTSTGKISGFFSVYDRLWLSAEDGDIDVRVGSKEGTGNAITDIRTTNGDIKVEFEPPNRSRNYRSAVETTSGNLSGRLLLGSDLSLKSGSGDIAVDVVGTGAEESFLRTENLSGWTQVTVEGTSGERVIGNHITDSGEIDVHYPSSWEGEIHAKATRGDVRLEGRGLSITQDLKGLVKGQEIWAEKGDASAGRIMARSMSSDVVVSIDA
ncbi:hypothetical protein TWF696_002719 [Orbilia brochopaga]|uniref:DUF4097 domain-containing protein n=1 Tax=Orbilia brochopaga TaxID=3140254 RepID=A0AAV9U4V3_9PEZI